MVEISNPWTNTLKAIFFVHFIFATWGIQGGWSPSSYLFYNCFFFLILLWSLHHRDSEDPLQMALYLNVLSIIFDIIVLAVYYPSYISTAGSERFSVGMAIINLLLRPISSVGLYRVLQDRAGFDAPLFPTNFGNILGNSSSQRSPYEDIDRSRGAGPPAAPDTARSSTSPTDKPYYNIVG